MALETNLNTTPYWDDFKETKDFYKILFKPGVSVQTRELNQIQSILQKQIERFGDNLFKSGTIISGVNFTYNPLYPYIKINDLTEDGQPVSISSYLGFTLKSSANLQAVVVNYEPGYESQSPDLNTLYVKYVNSGNTYDLTAFSNGELLEVINRNDQIFAVDVAYGGTGFANSDTLHIVSAISVNVTSANGFTNGEIITQANTGAKVQIVGIYEGDSANNKILSVKPLNTEQLSNTAANSSSWTIQPGYNVAGNTAVGANGATANVLYLVGGGASGVITTDSLGIVSTISLSSGGAGYTTTPVAVIKPSSASASVSTLEIYPRKYYARLRVAASNTNPVGYGYAFSISEGIIYQKGVFSRVDPQTVVVSKYNSSPSNVSVGFTSNESIVKYTTDTSLYDNASNTYNEGAPGADRLKIRPVLFVTNTDIAVANTEFLPLVEFVEGLPARENRETVYNEISREYERRTYETAGDFVINSFNTSTKELSNSTHFNIVVDPGTAYIKGKRISTKANILKTTQKANTVFSRNNQTITANYGNYVKVKNLAGFFKFRSGATVNLYDTAKSYLTNVTVGSSTTITPAGNLSGTARMRSLVYESGIIGTPDCVYRLYLFDISMNAGKSFSNVKSFYFDGTYDGICDAVTEVSGTSSENVTYLYDTEKPDIIFSTSLRAVCNIADVSYTYRTSAEEETLNANGTIVISAPSVSYNFPYSGSISLSSNQKKDFIVAPIANVTAANASGSVSGSTSLDYIVGTSTSFNTVFNVGDYVKIMETGGGSAVDIRRVTNIVNSTYMVLNANLSFTDSNANVALFFPAYYPIDLDRTNRTITTSANSYQVTIDLGNSSINTANVVASFNIKIPSATQITKNLNRDLYVKILCSNNETVSTSGNNTSGPWSLGIPDIFRLKNVYFGNTVTDTDVTKYFYVDSQSDGDKLKLSQLRLVPGSNLAISNSQWLLVKMDAFDVGSSEGYITFNSYKNIIDDGSGFSNNSYINTLEIPEVLTSEGRYYDPIECFDFRPYSVNTAILTSTVGSATINPSAVDSLNFDEKYFPVPDSQINFDVDFYAPRVDRVVLYGNYRLDKENRDRFNELVVLTGTPDIVNPKPPKKPSSSLSISTIFVPPYPSIPYSISNTTFHILNKKVGNDSSIVNVREKNYRIRNVTSNSDKRSAARPYSMASIGKLEKRIKAIENELLLSKLEASILNKTIPSSNDPSKERFKNGFVVDGFDNLNVVDLNSIENSCFIDVDKSELQPVKFTYNIESIFDRSHTTTLACITGNSQLMLKYEEVPIIQQLSASKPKNAVIPPVSIVPDVTTTTVGSVVYDETISAPSEITIGDYVEIKVYGGVPDSTFSFTGPTSGTNRLSSGGTVLAYFPWIEGPSSGPGTYTWTITFNGTGNVKTVSIIVKAKSEAKSSSGSSSVSSGLASFSVSGVDESSSGGSSGGGAGSDDLDESGNDEGGTTKIVVKDIVLSNDTLVRGSLDSGIGTSGGGSIVTALVSGTVGIFVVRNDLPKVDVKVYERADSDPNANPNGDSSTQEAGDGSTSYSNDDTATNESYQYGQNNNAGEREGGSDGSEGSGYVSDTASSSDSEDVFGSDYYGSGMMEFEENENSDPFGEEVEWV